MFDVAIYSQMQSADQQQCITMVIMVVRAMRIMLQVVPPAAPPLTPTVAIRNKN